MNNQDKGLFVKVDTVMADMEISKPMAYKFIAEWNEELKVYFATPKCNKMQRKNVTP